MSSSSFMSIVYPFLPLKIKKKLKKDVATFTDLKTVWIKKKL